MAVGGTLAAMDAMTSRPPDTNFPQIDLRSGRPVLDFDDALDESTHFTFLLPSSFSGGGVSVRLHWTSTSATTGSAVWEAAAELLAAGADLDADSFGTGVTQSAAAPSGAGELVVTPITVPLGGGQAAGQLLRIRISRLATDSADTLVGDVELFAIEVREA